MYMMKNFIITLLQFNYNLQNFKLRVSFVDSAQRPKQKKRIIDRENRITTISNRPLMEFLRGIAHNLSLNR